MLRSILGSGILLALVFGFIPSLYSQSGSVQLQIVSASSIDFTADQSSFTLNFSDFKSGSTTNTAEVNYSVLANNVVRSDDVVLARLDEPFPGIAFQAQFGSYAKKGGNSHLVESQSGFVAIGSDDIGLADKVLDEGDGKMLDGSFVIRYQAKALEDQAAGEHSRTLTVTVADT